LASSAAWSDFGVRPEPSCAWTALAPAMTANTVRHAIEQVVLTMIPAFSAVFIAQQWLGHTKPLATTLEPEPDPIPDPGARRVPCRDPG
jgi:hypothetical protein